MNITGLVLLDNFYMISKSISIYLSKLKIVTYLSSHIFLHWLLSIHPINCYLHCAFPTNKSIYLWNTQQKYLKENRVVRLIKWFEEVTLHNFIFMLMKNFVKSYKATTLIVLWKEEKLLHVKVTFDFCCRYSISFIRLWRKSN